jgi:hypothetical protein
MVEEFKSIVRMNEMQVAASKTFAASSKLAVAIVAGAAFLAFAPNANAVTFDTLGTKPTYGLGDTPNTQFNVPQVDAGAGSHVANTTIELNKPTFTTGANALLPAGNLSTFSETVKVPDLGSKTLNGASLSTLVLNDLTTGPNPGVGGLTSPATQTAATPLPAAILLFGSGLGAMGLFSWRRKIKASPAAAA